MKISVGGSKMGIWEENTSTLNLKGGNLFPRDVRVIYKHFPLISISLFLFGVNLIKSTPRGNPKKRKVFSGQTAENTAVETFFFF